MADGRILTAGVMLAIFATMVGWAFYYGPEAGFMPLVVGIPGLALTLIQFVTELRTKDAKVFGSEERQAEFRMFGWFFVFIAGITLFGFPYAAPLIIAIYLHFSWREKWWVSISAAAFAWIILHGVFEYVLGLPLFEGLVYDWLFY